MELLLIILGVLLSIVAVGVFVIFAQDYDKELKQQTLLDLDPLPVYFSHVKPHDDRLDEEDERLYWECLACGRRAAFFDQRVNDCPGGDRFGAYKAMEEMYQ
ncbi:MAG: hypothetical protein ACRDHZ_00175 [Ktedonobacteraceae bacterium]